MTKNDQLKITGHFEEIVSCKKNLSELRKIENLVAKTNRNDCPAEERILLSVSILGVAAFAFYTHLLSIVTNGDFTEIIAAAISTLATIAISIFYVSRAPKTYNDELFVLLKEYNPLSREDYDSLMSKIDSKGELNLIDIKLWIETEMDLIVNFKKQIRPKK